MDIDIDLSSPSTNDDNDILCNVFTMAKRHSSPTVWRYFQHTTKKQPMPVRHLPRDHPQVQHVNDFINYNIQEGLVDHRLVANFDQVWTCLFEPMRKTLWKPGSEKEKDDLAKYPRRQRIRAALQEHFGATVQQPAHEQNGKWKVKLATIRGYGGANTVNYWRQAYHCQEQYCLV